MWNSFAALADLEEELGKLVGPSLGRVFYVDGALGSESNSGSKDYPVSSLAAGYAKLRDGYNDTLIIVGNGGTGTARLSAVLDWQKSAAHLIGICAPGHISQRARIAPTAAMVAATPLITWSGSGCLVKDVSIWGGFTTGMASQITMLLSGQRNAFINTHIAGLVDTASAQNAASRIIKITGGENYFKHSVIGADTVARTVANAALEFASGAARNMFEDCTFPSIATAATPLAIIASAAAAMDRFQYFLNCAFLNAIKSTGTVLTALATLPASAGGMLVFKDCLLVGVTGFGSDATTRGQVYVGGGVAAAGTSGLAVAPTA